MKLKQMRHNESSCLADVCASISDIGRARIACRSEREIANVIATIVRQLPDARSMFAYRSWSQIDTIRGFLPSEVARLVPTRQQLGNHGVWHRRHLVPVNKLENCNPGDWDMIVTDADMALFPHRRDRLALVKQRNPDCRIYGTFDPGRRRTQEELFLQDALFGPILTQPAQSSIMVQWIDVGSVTIPDNLTPLQRTLQGYWHAPERLHAMKLQLDRVLKSVEVRKLAAPQEVRDGELQAYRVVILVDTPEHGRSVQTVWPMWPLETKCHSSSIAGLLSPRVIATVTAAEAGLIPPADLIVLAGRSTPRKYFGLLERYASTRSTPIQLIIPTDRFDDMAIQESQARYRQLAERRWQQNAVPSWLHNS
jgi:hypothetical protein